MWEKTPNKVIDTDVLVMGGGVGGCPAATKAAQLGLRVTLVEKAKTDRSGHSGVGMDHVMDFPREGVSLQDYVKYWQGRHHLLCGDGRFVNPNIGYVLGKEAWWCLEEMEKLGLPMKWEDGQYHWVRHGWFGVKIMLGVHWIDVKPKLAQSARESGVNVLERTMVVDLLTNQGRVVGATAVNTRTGEFFVIKAKAVIIATGGFARCYEPETPRYYKYVFRYHGAPGAVSGDGYAAGYRAGANLVNMDIGTAWNYRMRDDITLDFGVLDHGDGIRGKWFNWKGEEIPFPTAKIYSEVEKRGWEPIYGSVEHFNEDYHKRSEVTEADERLISLKLGQDRGFNPKTHRYEMQSNKPINFAAIGGLFADEEFKTTLKGLFVIGDACIGLGGCGSAIMSGLLTATKMPDYLNETTDIDINEAQVEGQKEVALAPLNVKDGTDPIELECAIRYICERYVGMYKSEGKLLEGLRRLNSLRRVFLPKVMAKNPHYLMRCLEVRNIMDLAEAHIKACLARKESRGNYIRTDYPDSDAGRDNMLTFQHLENGKEVLEIREIPDLKPEYAKEAK
ncbi:MAG: FAD-dependent oxidoreductase [Dehalococcoidales bacterium]|nr:FAD-dependent oxidoreductase [Dehalococcoidales bacterium]